MAAPARARGLRIAMVSRYWSCTVTVKLPVAVLP